MDHQDAEACRNGGQTCVTLIRLENPATAEELPQQIGRDDPHVYCTDVLQPLSTHLARPQQFADCASLRGRYGDEVSDGIHHARRNGKVGTPVTRDVCHAVIRGN